MVDPKPVLMLGVISQVQDLTFPFEFHEVLVCPFLQLVNVCLSGSMSIWYTNYSSQFCIICKLAEGVLCLIVQVISEEVSLGSSIDLWGIASVTGLQLDHLLLIMTLSAW